MQDSAAGTDGATIKIQRLLSVEQSTDWANHGQIVGLNGHWILGTHAAGMDRPLRRQALNDRSGRKPDIQPRQHKCPQQVKVYRRFEHLPPQLRRSPVGQES